MINRERIIVSLYGILLSVIIVSAGMLYLCAVNKELEEPIVNTNPVVLEATSYPTDGIHGDHPTEEEIDVIADGFYGRHVK